MIRKIIGILIVMLVVFTAIPTMNSINTNDNINIENPLSKGLFKCIRNQEFQIESGDENNYEPYVMNERTKEQIKRADPNMTSPKPGIVDVPDEFSWKNYQGKDWTSPIKRQECGDCWLFAAIGGLECIINLREGSAELDPDLSEQYVLSCFPEAGSCKGGFSYKAYQYMMDTSSEGNNHNGALLESCFRYVGIDSNGCDYYNCNHDPVLCSEKCDDWVNYLVPIKDFERWFPDGSQKDIDRIKSSIYENGPVLTSFLANDEFGEWVSTHHDPDDYFPYTGEVTKINHCVVLVGWKDDPSIGNGGYWIVRNSWGMYSGYDGFFNIEYGALGIDSTEIVEVDYDPESYDWLPKADSGGLYHGNAGNSITFDASNSFDVESEIISYEWDFGDGTTGTGSTTSHSYLDRGTYLVTLTVTDESDNIGSEETNALIDFWKFDDSWIYDVSINLEMDGVVSGNLNFDLKDFVITVSEVTSDDYILNFQGDLKGEFTATVFNFDVGGKIPKSIKINGNLVIDKKTLGIREIVINAQGRFSIGKNPSSLFGLPLPFELNAQINFDDDFEIVNLPFKSHKSLDISPKNYNVDGELKSIWLSILNVINKLTGQALLPPEIGNLLPVIDFSEMLEAIGLENLRFQGYPYTCEHNGEISVNAGTFDTFMITVESAYTDTFLCNYYFAPDICNIILIDADFDEHQTLFGTLNGDINAELKSTNYS